MKLKNIILSLLSEKEVIHMEKPKKLDGFPFLTKITEDIYKLSIQFPFGMRQVNSFLFKGENGFTVMDTGSHSQESIEIWKQVLSMGITVEKILFTHTHQDHIGLAGWFQENFHVPVYISDLGLKELKKKSHEEDYGKVRKSLFQQHGGPEIPEELMVMEPYSYDFIPDGVFESEQRIKIGYDMYETISTPGHSPDHICFYNHERKLMVTGDHVMDGISSSIAVWSNENDFNPLKYYFESLDLVSGYSTNLALPGHGELITNLSKRIGEIKSGHQNRMEQILESIKNEEKTAGQIYKEIYGRLSIYKFFKPFMATITRLIYLESVGKVNCVVGNGQSYYHTVG